MTGEQYTAVVETITSYPEKTEAILNLLQIRKPITVKGNVIVTSPTELLKPDEIIGNFTLQNSEWENWDVKISGKVQILNSGIKELNIKGNPILIVSDSKLVSVKGETLVHGSFKNCPKLVEISFGKITELYTGYCAQLSNLASPRIEKLKMEKCGINTLELTEIVRLELNKCQELTKLSCPNYVETVDIDTCPKLTSLGISHCKDIELNGAGVEALSGLNATFLGLSHVRSLRKLNNCTFEGLVSLRNIDNCEIGNCTVKALDVDSCNSMKLVRTECERLQMTNSEFEELELKAEQVDIGSSTIKELALIAKTVELRNVAVTKLHFKVTEDVAMRGCQIKSISDQSSCRNAEVLEQAAKKRFPYKPALRFEYVPRVQEMESTVELE